MPGWIPDVLTRTTIRSVWGNTIRDQVVQSFATSADLAAQAHPVEGMLAWATQERTLWLYVTALGGWRVVAEPWRPLPLSGFSCTNQVHATGGLIEYRRFNLQYAKCRGMVMTDGGVNFVGQQVLTVFPGVTFGPVDTRAVLGRCQVFDSQTGLSIGFHAIRPGPTGVQSGFYVQGNTGQNLIVGGPASSVVWSMQAGTIFDWEIDAVYT
jgi:hypothetical protein